MGRVSAKYVAPLLEGFSTSDVYEMWCKMGLVVKDKFGDWVLTPLGRSMGGRMSKSNYCPVPTFDLTKVISLMDEFWEQHHK